MACTYTLTGIAADCAANLSGVKEIAFAVADESKIDSSLASYAGDLDWAVFEMAKYSGSMTNTLTKDDTTGVLYYTTEVTGQINKMDVDKNKSLEELALVPNLAVSVVDKNGNNWGFVNATLTALTGQTGAAMDDGNFYSITVTGINPKLPYYQSTPAFHKMSN